MILIIDDDIAVITSLSLLLENEGYEVKYAQIPAEALSIIEKSPPELIILDLNFSNETSGKEGLGELAKIKRLNSAIPVILITGWGSIDLAVRGMKMGASDFINKPWSNEHLLQSIKTLIDLKERRGNSHTRKQLDRLYNFQHIVGEDPLLLSILETIGQVANTDASVLIVGEKGTGKELIAETIHQNSLRKNKPFVRVNLGGVSGAEFESEMFGHVRGAFTDTRYDRVGRFEIANKGTIFLDEIGDLESSSQVKLLRVLQDRTFEVIGINKTKNANVRVICATRADLDEMVKDQKFREDLLYRINLITIKLPTLAQRPKDIPLLANHFVNNLKELYNRPELQISSQALKWLQQLRLPGNVSQLKNIVERSVLISRNEQLEIEDFRSQMEQSPVNRGSIQLPGVGSLTLEEMEVNMIRKAIEYHNNKVSKAAKSLGITRSSLYRRLDKFKIPYEAEE